MKLPRSKFLRLAAGAATLPAVSRCAWAQGYPARPVRIVVGFAAGGGTDIVARLIGQWLSERLGQSFIVDNRPGANTIVATETVARAQPDGYTLLTVGHNRHNFSKKCECVGNRGVTDSSPSGLRRWQDARTTKELCQWNAPW